MDEGAFNPSRLLAEMEGVALARAYRLALLLAALALPLGALILLLD